MSTDDNDKKVKYSYDFNMESFFKTDDVKEEEHVEVINQESQPADSKSKKKLILYISLIAIVLIVIVVVIICSSRNKVLDEKTIKFNEDCFNLILSEYEGVGGVRVTPNYEEIKDVVMDVLEKKDYDEEELKEQFLLFYDAINISAEVDGELINGNNVKVSIYVRDKVLEEFDVAIDNTEFTVEITGLDTVQEVNPFEYMKVYSMEPVENESEIPIFFTYPEEYFGLTAEDFIVISNENQMTKEFTIAVESSAIIRLEKQGIILTQTDYFFNINEVDGTVVRDFEELYDSIFDNLKINAHATISVMYEDEPEVTLDEIEYYGGWLNIYSYPRGNELELIYKTTVSHNAGVVEPMTLYVKVTYSDIVESDGVVTVMGDYAVVDTMPTYVQSGDEMYYMGIGKEDYAEFLFDKFLSSSTYAMQFDQDGNITEY